MKKLAIIPLKVAQAAVGAAADEEVNALRESIKSNSVNRTTRSAYYKAWYGDQCAKEELAAGGESAQAGSSLCRDKEVGRTWDGRDFPASR